MWIGDTMYFVSDRGADGITNIYAQDLEDRRGPAGDDVHEKFDVMMPETDGERIVYVQDGYLYVLDVAAGSAAQGRGRRCPSDRWRLRDRWINPRIHPRHGRGQRRQGRGARGPRRRFPPPLADKDTMPRNLTADAGRRARSHPRLSPDGQWLAFFSDTTGEYQLYVRDVAGGEWSQLTTDLDRAVYRLAWSPDGKKILFGNKDLLVFYRGYREEEADARSTSRTS